MKRNTNEIKILITRSIPDIGIDLLRKEEFSLTVWPHDSPMPANEMIEQGKEHHVLITLTTDPVDNNFLTACSHLELISQFGAGYDNIDIPLATKLGIPVGNTPGAMTEATADIAFGLMIAVSRKFFYMHKTIPKGEWTCFRPKDNLGFELNNKTLGIFGLGRIGLAMARRCKGAYNMNIIYCNRTPNAEAEKLFNAKRVSFDELLRQSDIVSVHSVLSNETKEIFDKAAFAKMKSSTVFINASRGGIHNEVDLIDALKNGTIWGVGLDVTNPEPMKSDNLLLSMENVCILPHIGSATVEARNEMSRLAAENVISFYKNNVIPHLVNPEVFNAK